MTVKHSESDGARPLSERVYRALRADLMSGAFPPSERLGEGKLAARYEVSRTPIREALARLVADGLVQRGDSGLYPYRPKFADLNDLYELRFTLELRGFQRLLDSKQGHHDPDVLGPELDHWHALRANPPRPDAGFVDRDEQFHVTLLAAAGNMAFVEALHAVNARIRPVRMYDYLTPDRMAATIFEHITVLELALDRRLEEAQAALHAHIDASRAVVVARAEQAISMARMASALQP